VSSRVALGIIAATAIAAAALTSQIAFVVVAVVALLGLATTFGRAGQLTSSLKSFEQQVVRVRVWGASLPVDDGATVTVASVWALGAGLHLSLRVGPGGSARDLKIAQPGGMVMGPERVLVQEASYVQWAGKRLPRAPGTAALDIALRRSSA
jgi:hypothetical protein